MSNISWDQATKDKWVPIMESHQQADRIMQGKWLREGKDDSGLFRGCFFGCAMQTDKSPLEKAIKAMKLPGWLIYTAEKIFEGLPSDEAVLFPVQLLSDIPVDTDLTSVECNMHIKRLNRLLDIPNLPNNVISAINGVIDCWTNRLNGVPEADIPWNEAAEAAEEAEEEAVMVVEKASMETRASRAASRAAAWAAWAAQAMAAERVVAWAAQAREEEAKAGFWRNERDTMITLLTNVSNN